jgi:hypothetical protein
MTLVVAKTVAATAGAFLTLAISLPASVAVLAAFAILGWVLIGPSEVPAARLERLISVILGRSRDPK